MHQVGWARPGRSAGAYWPRPGCWIFGRASRRGWRWPGTGRIVFSLRAPASGP